MIGEAVRKYWGLQRDTHAALYENCPCPHYCANSWANGGVHLIVFGRMHGTKSETRFCVHATLTARHESMCPDAGVSSVCLRGTYNTNTPCFGVLECWRGNRTSVGFGRLACSVSKGVDCQAHVRMASQVAAVSVTSTEPSLLCTLLVHTMLLPMPFFRPKMRYVDVADVELCSI
jgi:hypothetical protein